jgi:hypothetical protein
MKENLPVQNHRRFERIALLIAVEFESAGVWVKGRITNMGTLGVFIETDSPLPVGAHLRLRFSLEGGQEIQTPGVVAHRQTGMGMGVAFISIGSEEVKQIEKLIDGEKPS